MKALRTFLFALALSAFAMPAHAAWIGLSGGDYDPPSITNATIFQLEACTVQTEAFPTGYFCNFYSFADVNGVPGDDPVFSFDFRVLDVFGNYLPVVGGNLYTNAELSDLDAALIASPLFADGFTFRLTGLSGSELAQFISPTNCGSAPGDPCELAFFLGPDEFTPSVAGFSGASVGVNDIANPGVALVSEPATLLLIAPSAVFLARQLRRKKRLTATLDDCSRRVA